MYRIKYLMMSALLALFVSGCGSLGSRPDVGQLVFSSGDEACASLKDAIKKNDTKRMMEIFGPNGEEIVFSGDDNLDAESRAYFAKNADQKMEIVELEDEEGTFIVELGEDGFPFAVPLSQYDGKWFFNTPEGLDELLNRRIGRNEIYTIKVCEAIAEAEVKYAKMKIAVDGIREYALSFLSETGKFNGLYWNPDTEKKENLICAALANAALEPGNPKREPYYGYYYKVLKAQGPDAPGGKKSYLVDGKLKNGYAVVAYPANYDVLGIKSFMVSKSGIVFEKDLGDDTEKIALEMTEFNPDDTWDPVRN